jgi:hypothetical protein
VFFHQGAPALGDGALRTDDDLEALRAAAAAHLSPAGQLQVATALGMLAALEARLDVLRHRLLAAARGLTGARVLAAWLYGVGPVTALAMTCWLGGAGRFSSSRKAVRFAGLDVTVYSSDSRRPPGRLSRQGPEVLRWAVYEAGKTHARASAPDHRYYAQVRDRKGGKRAALSEAARSSARPAISWPGSATTRSPPPEPAIPSHGGHRDAAGQAGEPEPNSPDGAPWRPAPASPLSAAPGPAAQGQADGLHRLSGRIPPQAGGHPIDHHSGYGSWAVPVHTAELL